MRPISSSHIRGAPAETPNSSPVVVALIGLPGAGKTTLAEYSASDLRARILSRDDLRSRLVKRPMFSAEENARLLDRLLEELRENCRSGRNTIVDGLTFAREGELERVQEAAHAGGARFVAVWLDCPVEIAQARVRRDLELGRHSSTNRTPELVHKTACAFRKLPPHVTKLDAQAPTKELGQHLLARVFPQGRIGSIK